MAARGIAAAACSMIFRLWRISSTSRNSGVGVPSLAWPPRNRSFRTRSRGISFSCPRRGRRPGDWAGDAHSIASWRERRRPPGAGSDDGIVGGQGLVLFEAPGKDPDELVHSLFQPSGRSAAIPRRNQRDGAGPRDELNDIEIFPVSEVVEDGVIAPRSWTKVQTIPDGCLNGTVRRGAPDALCPLRTLMPAGPRTQIGYIVGHAAQVIHRSV